MEATQSFKRKRTRIVRTRPIGGDLTYDGNRLWTSASSGQYEVRFKNIEIEDVWFKGKLLPRLVMRFEVLGGPMSMNEAGKWEHGNRNAGKVLPVYQFLGNDVDNPVLSPNCWLSQWVTRQPFKRLDEQLQAFGRQARYALVVCPFKGVSKIEWISFPNPLSQDVVERYLQSRDAV